MESATRNLFTIYANVKSFKSWIVETVGKSGVEVGEPTMNVTLNCSYNLYAGQGIAPTYGCELNNFEIRNEHIEVASISGVHLVDEDDDDVEVVHFNSGLMFTLPVGLGK